MSRSAVNKPRVETPTEKAFNRKVANRLLDRRGPRSQEVFARAIDVAQQTVSNYERGEIPGSWLILARLREREGVDLNDLLAWAPGRNGR